MPQAQIRTAGLEGIDAYPVEVEVSLGGGLPRTVVVGLPDAELREAKDRVRAAIKGSGYKWPQSLVVINLVPAHRRKEAGAAFDLPIALAILSANDQYQKHKALRAALTKTAAMGELTLAGRVQSFRGALAAGQALAEAPGLERLLVARGCAASVALGTRGRLEVIPVESLSEAVGILVGEISRDPVTPDPEAVLAAPADDDLLDLTDVRGADAAKDALVVAAAGAHNLLLIGPPGAGKTMLARRLPGLLPRPTLDDALEITRVHGLVRGALEPDASLVRRRPFRAPHHTASDVALVGGGSTPRPGEISLAHKGVLFLDELPEFSTRALEALREPLESQVISVSRARYSVTYPADFQLVAAMNPCPCGYVAEPRRPCTCRPSAVERYGARISGPLSDRIDLCSTLSLPPFEVLTAPTPTGDPLSTAAVRERVIDARAIQLERSGCLNARLDARELQRVVALTPAARRILGRACRTRLLTGRGVSKVQKIARTLADLGGRDKVEPTDVSMALSLRVGDQLSAAA